MSLRLSNRRKQPDLILRSLAWSNGIAVISLFLAVCLIAIAKPKKMNFLDHFYDVQRLSPAWNKDMIGYIGVMLLISFIASVIGILLNGKRLRRNKDHVHATLVLSLIASTISLFFFLRFTLG